MAINLLTVTQLIYVSCDMNTRYRHGACKFLIPTVLGFEIAYAHRMHFISTSYVRIRSHLGEANIQLSFVLLKTPKIEVSKRACTI